MKIIFKWIAGSVVGVLLGVGLCGLDQAMHPRNHDALGGSISFFGFTLCVFSGLILLASVLVLLGKTMSGV